MSQPPPSENTDEPTQQFGVPGELQRVQTQPFEQPLYGQQPPYGQPPYGQPPWYPQGQYGQSPYGQPGGAWGPPGGPGGQQPRRSNSTLIALIIAGVVVVAAIGVALFLLFGRNVRTNTAGSATSSATPATSENGSSSPSASAPGGGTGIPPAGASPDGLGDDPVLDQYAQSCHDGDMSACDTLYNQAAAGSKYETYGGTCAGRQPARSSDVVYCTEAFPG